MRAAVQEAAAAGIYVSEHYPDHRYPRVPILTIDELLAGAQADLPPLRPRGHSAPPPPPFVGHPARLT